jgi:hypothetical protein
MDHAALSKASVIDDALQFQEEFFRMSDGREERQQQEQRRQQEQQEERIEDRRKYVDDHLDRFPVDPFHPERPDS